MLVLTRKAGESIMIGTDIEVTVLSVDGGNIRIGIKAPKEVTLHRRELYDAIREENLKALSTARNLGGRLNDILKKI